MTTTKKTEKTEKKVAAKAPKAEKKANETNKLADYAVLYLGSKQQLVRLGDKISVELMPEEVGSKVEIADVVLLVKQGDKVTVGQPTIAGATVSASVLEVQKGEKLTIFHKKRRKHHRKRTGHRQHYTILQIDAIKGLSHGA